MEVLTGHLIRIENVFGVDRAKYAMKINLLYSICK